MADTTKGHKPTSTQIMASVACIIIFGINVSYQVVNMSFPFIIKDMGIDKIQASMLPTLVSLGVVVMALIGTKLIDKLTPRWSMLTGTLLVTAFLVINAFVSDYMLWVASGLLAGFGSALGTSGAIAALMRQYWGPTSGSKFSLVAGIQTFIVTSYSALMAYLWAVMDYRTAFLVIAAITFVLGVGCNLFLLRKPDAFVAEELKAAELKAAEAAKGNEGGEEKDGWTFAESFKHSPMYLFTIAFVAAAIINGGITTFLTTFLTENGVDPSMAALVQSYFTFICGLHIVYSGFVQQKFGNKVYFIWFYGLSAVGFVVLGMWAGLATGAMIPLLLVALCLVGCMKPILSCAGVVVPALFGQKDYTAYNSYSQATLNVGRLISSASTATILQAFGSIALCYIFAGLSIFATVGFCIADAVSPFAKKARKGKKVEGDPIEPDSRIEI